MAKHAQAARKAERAALAAQRAQLVRLSTRVAATAVERYGYCWGLENGRGRPIDLSTASDQLTQEEWEQARPALGEVPAGSNFFSGDSGRVPQHADNEGAREPPREPPEDWQDARPVQGETILLPPPKPGVPAFYPAPTEDTATAKGRLDAAMTVHMTKGRRLHQLRRNISAEADDEIAFFNQRIGPGEYLTSGERGAIKRRHHREIAEREGFGAKLPPPPRHQFTSTPGSGKTTVARGFAATSPGEVTWITELTFEKLVEEYTAYLLEPDPKPPAMLIRGRDRNDPKRPGHYMCERKDAARAIAEANMSVPKVLCSGCEFAKVCGDHRQRRESQALVDAGNGATFFLAGAYVFLAAPVPKPDHGILYESLLQLATDVRAMPIADLAKLSVPNIDTTSADTATTLRAILDAFTLAHPTTPERVAAGDDQIMPRALAYLRHAGIDKKALKYLAKATETEIDRQTPQIGAWLTDSQIEEALEGGDRRTLRQLLVLISAIKLEIDIPRETATGVWLREIRIGGTHVPALGIARMRKLRGLKKAFLTILDGTGKLALAQRLFGEELVETNIRFDRQAYVTGTKGKGYSKTSITAEDRDGNIIRFKEKSAGRLRGDIAKIYDRLPAGSSVFATKRVEEILIDSGAVPASTPTMHWHELRGSNARKNDPGGLFVGAENITIADVEATARAFLATDPVPFVSMDHAPTSADGWKRWEHQWHYWATRMRRMRDGTLSPVEVPVHPDPRVQAVLELTREDELIQGVDRLRSIWNRRQITLLNTLCLDLTYDEILTHKHLVAGGNPITRALLATGIVPLSPADLHRAHRDIFRSPKAAEHALRNYPQNQGETLFWVLGVVPYRRAGQHGPEARVLLDRTRWPDNAALIAAIEAFAGPLASFDGVPLHQGAPPGNTTTTPRGPGWVPPEPSQPGRGAAPPSVWVHGPPNG